MRRVMRCAMAGAIVLIMAPGAWAQQPDHQHGAAQSAPRAATPGHDHDAQHMQHMMQMCQQMMGQQGMMRGGGMMGGMGPGMMGGQPDSPRMMQMRGEMMKAMGDIMLKYGQMMEGSK